MIARANARAKARCARARDAQSRRPSLDEPRPGEPGRRRPVTYVAVRGQRRDGNPVDPGGLSDAGPAGAAQRDTCARKAKNIGWPSKRWL
jgi:hypothetical protein